MSAFGRGQAGEVGREVVEVIRQVMREFDALGRSVRGAAGGVGGAAFRFATDNFVTNASGRAGRNFAIDSAAGIAGDFAKFGGSLSLGASAGSNFLRAASKVPIVGDVFSQIQDPLEATGNRVAAITSQVARAGGTVDPAARRRLFDLFHPQEQRAENERREVEKLQAQRAGTGDLEGTQYAKGLDAVVDFTNAIKEAADWLRSFGGSQR